MKILLLSSWYPTKSAPFLGNFVVLQAELLQKEHEVVFIRLLKNKEETEIQSTDFQFLDVYYKPYSNPILNYLSKRKALKKALKQLNDIDLIHAHVSYPNGGLFQLAKKQLKVPMVLTEHGSYFSPKTHWTKRMNWIIPSVLKSADKVVAVSPLLAKDIQKRIPSIHPIYIPNPVDINRYVYTSKNENLTHFLHVSTLSKIKNVIPIIDAFIQLEKTNASVQLTIVSDENYEVFQKYALDNGTKEIHFVGPIDHHSIPTFYENADCLVMNSDYESFSIVIAEAWSSGIPVVSTSVGIATDLPEFLGIQTDGSTTNIYEAMNKFIANKSTYNPIQIREYARQFSNDAVLNQLNSLYKELLTEN